MYDFSFPLPPSSLLVFAVGAALNMARLQFLKFASIITERKKQRTDYEIEHRAIRGGQDGGKYRARKEDR